MPEKDSDHMDTASDLVMSSTTDSPEQIRAGLGLPVEEAAPVEEPATGEEPTLEEPAAPETTETDEEPAAVPAVEAKAPVAAAPAKKRITPAQKELDKVAARARRDAEARSAVLEAENKALRDRLTQSALPPEKVAQDPDVSKTFEQRKTALGAKPKQVDFEDFDQFEEKRDEWLIAKASLETEERLAHQGAASRADLARDQATRDGEAVARAFEASKQRAFDRHADHQEVMDRAKAANLVIANHVREAVLSSGDEAGEVAYHLAADHALLTRLNGLSPAGAAIEVGRLVQRLSSPAGGPQPPPARPRSHAPAPLGTELGGGPSAVTNDLESATSQQDYNRMRDKQDKARGRRR